MDLDGNVYLTGMVDGTFPTTPGAYSGPGTIVPEIFVAKFSKDGTTMIYSTYISGSSVEMGVGLAIDSIGQAYMVGFAGSDFTGTTNYPSTPSAFQPNIFTSGGNDAILTVLNAAGTGLVYSTYLGGSNDDEAYDVAIGADGLVYITGFTSSSTTTFPLKANSITSSGGRDVFIAKFDINQSGANSLIYYKKIFITCNEGLVCSGCGGK